MELTSYHSLMTMLPLEGKILYLWKMENDDGCH